MKYSKLTNLVKITVRVQRAQAKRLDRISKQYGRCKQDLMAEALGEFLGAWEMAEKKAEGIAKESHEQ